MNSVNYNNKLTNYERQRNVVLPWQNNQPAWNETAEKAILIRKIALAAGISFLAIGSLSALLFNGFPFQSKFATIISTSVAGSISVGSLIFYVYLRSKKEFWNDPAYCQKKREEILLSLLEKGYRQTSNNYFTLKANPENEFWDIHRLVRRDEIGGLLMDHHFNPKGSTDPSLILTAIQKDGFTCDLLIQDNILKKDFISSR